MSEEKQQSPVREMTRRELEQEVIRLRERLQDRNPDVEEWWRPDLCPITGMEFFMWIRHPDSGWVPTYGGPLDSYTIPEADLEDPTVQRPQDIEFRRERYDHDEGAWREGCESITERVVTEEQLHEWNAFADNREGEES